jgi:hypothetical protein
MLMNKALRPSGVSRLVAFFLLAAASATGIQCVAAVSFAVVPSADTRVMGSTTATNPFSQSSVRYQQVYSASDISQSGLITEIAFRPSGGGQSGQSPWMPTALTHVKVLLSRTGRAPGDLSTSFASNLGSDATIVYDGPWSFSTSYTGPSGMPNAFDIRLRLTTPFPYNPAKGNLLLDIALTSAVTGIPAVDADDTGETVSRVYAPDAAASVASEADGKGIITQFTFGSFRIATGCGSEKKQFAWIAFTDNVAGIRAKNSSIAEHFFNNPCTLIPGVPSSNPVPAEWASIPVADYQSFAKFQSDVSTGNIINSVMQAVLYDNEHWTQTPSAEQKDPSDYTMLFANLAHAQGYAFISAPSTDLVPEQKTYQKSGKIYPQYLSMGFPRFSVRSPADVYDIQAQGSEPALGTSTKQCSGTELSNINTFTPFVECAALQAAKANPSTVLLAGISTNPSGQKVTAQQMQDAVNATKSLVSGYWLNIPNGSSGWPVAISFLKLLRNAGF